MRDFLQKVQTELEGLRDKTQALIKVERDISDKKCKLKAREVQQDTDRNLQTMRNEMRTKLEPGPRPSARPPVEIVKPREHNYDRAAYNRYLA